MDWKSLVVAAASFVSLPAMAADIRVTFTMETAEDIAAHREEIVSRLDEETYDLLLKAVESGSAVTLSFEDESMEDGQGGQNGSGNDNCTVKVTERKSGNAEASVGGRAVGSGSAGGSSDRTFEVSGPCKEVKEIVRDIINNTPRTPDKHNNALMD